MTAETPQPDNNVEGEAPELEAEAALAARRQIDPTEYLVGTSDAVRDHEAAVANLSDDQRVRYDAGVVEDAAVREPKLPNSLGKVGEDLDKQAAINKADRQTRQDAGLPPRPYELR